MDQGSIPCGVTKIINLIINCLNCDKPVFKKDHRGKFCNQDCDVEFKLKEKYLHYLNNQEEYCSADRNLKFLKQHILKEQNEKCVICSGLNLWNDKKLVFILDHIDGNASNNLRINLRLICPNCDSQLDTFKSKNKNSARKERYLKSIK